MIAEIGQAATTAGGGFLSGTGTFVIDGAILIAVLKIVEAGINKIRNRGNGKKPPCPGEAVICREHGEAIATVETSISEFKQFTTQSLSRIENKVDRILERGGK